ncbi:TolC family protein [bacterium]|nr:TolC family protein [bacterium]MBU1995043.1 TolC family protein [bacterium]
MLRIISVCFALAVIVQAQNLNEIISHSLESHNSLRSIEQKISSFNDALELSQNFQNPELSLSIGDIQFKEPLNRSIEPMQYTSLNIKQKIPYFGKRAANASLVNAQKDIVFSSLQEAKVALVKEIKITAYTIWELEQKLLIIDEYIKLAKSNIELSNAYGSSGESWHVEIASMQLSLLELNIKYSRMNSALKSLYAKLSYLGAKEIKSVQVDADVMQPKSLDTYAKDLLNNKSYAKQFKQVQEKNSLVKVKELDSNIDPFISVGYFYREAFEDYISVSVGAALPLYGSEDLNVQKARKEVLEAELNKTDVYEKLKVNLGEAHAELLSNYEVYLIISQRSIVELEHMIEVAESMLKNGKNLLSYTKLLEKKLSLDEQKFAAQAAYKRAEANIEALKGEIQ